MGWAPALANALEDLAWVLGEESEKNYPAAIDAFSKAIAANYAAADPYTKVFSLLAGAATTSAVHLQNDILNLPIYMVDAAGRVTGVLPR